MSEHHEDILLAHRYRLGLSPPSQSSFRVVAVIFYEPLSGNPSADDENTTPLHVVGTNDEPCHIGGSICAERAAMLQLRFLPIKKITKIVIVTDAKDDISPGLLCREYLASSSLTTWDTKVILTGSVCRFCRSPVDADGAERPCQINCSVETSTMENHDYSRNTTTLRKLYPHPSPYTRLSARQAVDFGKRSAISSSSNSINELFSQKDDKLPIERKKQWLMLLSKATSESNRDSRKDLHPIQYGAAVLFSDGSVNVAHQKKAIEYGCTLDAVGQLAHVIQEKCESTDSMEEKYTIRPLLLVQADQFGLPHAPFAPGRSFLCEHGFGDVKVLCCSQDLGVYLEVRASDLSPDVPKMEGGLLLGSV